MKQIKTVTLYFKEGSSDKVYQASIDEVSTAQYTVNFAYGRRGASLKTGTKTSSAVDLTEAQKVFDKIVGEKTSKGYTEGENGTPYQANPQLKTRSSYVPQLLNPIEELTAQQLLENDAYILQEKKDGTRCVLDAKADGTVESSNKKGLITTTSMELVKSIQDLGVCTLDGEAIGDLFFAFDLLTLNGKDLRKLPYMERLSQLTKLLENQGKKNPIQLVPTATGTKAKKALFARLMKEEREGVVFKESSAPYVSGRPASGGNHLKFKFYNTCSVYVTKVNQKRSVSFALFDAYGTAAETSIDGGNATIPPNKDIPNVGDVIELRYLYAYKGGALFQTTYLGLRSDVDPSECTMDQLKFKSEEVSL